MAGTVDRRGFDDVMSGYDMYSERAPVFSLWQGRQLKFAHTESDSGREILEENLRAAAATGTTGVYTLRFHKSADKDGFVSDKTAYIGSFNFKLNENDYAAVGAGVAGFSGPAASYRNAAAAAVDERLQRIESVLADLAEEGEEGEDETENNPIMGAIGEIIKNPQILNGLLGSLFGNAAPAAVPALPAGGGIAGIPEDQDKKIKAAIDVLRVAVPDLGDVMLKLADLARNNPQKLQFALSML